MNYEPKIEIVVFPNNKKKNEKSPDHTGFVTFPDGKKLEVALWNRSAKDSGMPFLSGIVSEPYKPNGGGGNSSSGNKVAVDF